MAHTAPYPTKRPPLFRARAIEAASGSQIGEPLKTYWRGVAIATLLGFALLGALILFAAEVEYAPVRRVPSYVDARGGLVRLSAPIGGQVRELAVEPGAVIQRGALLAVLDSDRLRADGGSQHDAERARLTEERASVERELEAARAEANANNGLIERRLSGLRAERAALEAQIAAGVELLQSLQAQNDQLAAVAARGYVPKLQATQKKDDVTAQRSKVAELRSSLAHLDLEIGTTEAERQVTAAKLAGELQERSRSGGELERRIVQSDADAQQAVRAPVDGVVSTALIARGQSVGPGQLLFTITPADQALILRLIVPARAAASVQVGAAVKLAFSAYPQEKFGLFNARIDSVSDTPILPAELAGIYPLNEPAFIATASLPAQRLPDGRPLKVKPGMLADALVPIERRSVLDWLFEPLLSGFHHSADQARTAPTGPGA
jgi:membrane fusion protein